MDNIISVSVIVFKDDNILFVKPDREDGGLRLTLPGDKLKFNENIEECGTRAVKEAIGININLDKKLGGVITRRNKQGNFLVTFIFMAETVENIQSSRVVDIPYKKLDRHSEISAFSRLIIDRINESSSGMDRFELKGTDGKEYSMYY